MLHNGGGGRSGRLSEKNSCFYNQSNESVAAI